MKLIRKYENRKLYLIGSRHYEAGYLTVRDILLMIKSGDEVKIIQNKTNEDITKKVLTKGIHTYISQDTTLDSLIENIKGSEINEDPLFQNKKEAIKQKDIKVRINLPSETNVLPTGKQVDA